MEREKFKRSLTRSDLWINRRLPWSLYSPHGALLLTEGALIRSEKQIQSLLNVKAHYLITPNPAIYSAMASHRTDLFDDVSSFVIVHKLLERLEYAFELRHTKGSAFVRKIMQLVFDIQDACEKAPDAMLGTVQLIVEAPHGLLHPLHMALMCEIASCRMGQGPLERFPLVAAALTHDIGMYEIQQQLFEQNTSLSDSQKRIVHQHPKRSYELLLRLGVTEQRWLEPVLQNHERLDGSGYPEGLKADQICREARLLAITDCYSAMIRPRAYRGQLMSRDALREIFQQRGKTIDETLARLFIEVMGLFAPGTLVRLKGRQVALVTGRGEGVNKPELAVITNRLGDPLDRPVQYVLQDSNEIKEILRIQDHTHLIAGLGKLWTLKAQESAAA